ncbi:MAG: hypothetical protein KF784_01145 [Fimbriimonadaceae bacterium]|nr:hypothetical protein [Fimbriimonadaceae bacterium]
MRPRRKNTGGTLIEVLTASFIGSTVLLITISVFIAGMASWLRGQSKINAESQAQNAVRIISQELREAMVVTVDTDGKGLSYRLPAKGSNGNYTVPATWDGVARRIELQGSKIVVTKPSSTRVITEDVILTDPLSTGGSATYKIFTAGPGTIVRSLSVMVVTKTAEYRKETNTSRSRELIFLRNIPDLARG